MTLYDLYLYATRDRYTCDNAIVEDKHNAYQPGDVSEWKDGLHQKTTHGWIKLPGQKGLPKKIEGKEAFNKLSETMKNKSSFSVGNQRLGAIEVPWYKSGHGLYHIIQRRFDEQYKDGKGETDYKKIKQNITASLYCVLQTLQHGVNVQLQKDNNSWIIREGGFSAIVKKDKGKFLFTGFYDHENEKEAADSIKAVNAKYRYTPGFLDIYDRVGAALTSMKRINE